MRCALGHGFFRISPIPPTREIRGATWPDVPSSLYGLIPGSGSALERALAKKFPELERDELRPLGPYLKRFELSGDARHGWTVALASDDPARAMLPAKACVSRLMPRELADASDEKRCRLQAVHHQLCALRAHAQHHGRALSRAIVRVWEDAPPSCLA